MRRTIATLGALLATLAVAGPAAASVAAPVTVTKPVPIVHPANYSGGLYQWDVTALPAGSASEFTLGTKIGHCVNFIAPPGASTTATLLSGSDVDLRTTDPLGIKTAGTGDPRVAQVKWLLISSLARALTNKDLAAGHQLAIWRITNPSNGPTTSEGDIYDDSANAAAPTLSQRLLAEAQASGASANNAVALLGSGDTCAGTTRAITVTGAPFSKSVVTITGGGTVAGLTSLTVDLGATGSAVLNVLAPAVGVVTVSATGTEATMIQVKHAPVVGDPLKQDVATIQPRTVKVSTTITFVDCTPPTVVKPTTTTPPVVKTPIPKVVAIAKLTIVKGADRAKVTSGGIVHYTITVRNTDSDAAINVRTCDQLPDGMTYVSIGNARLRRGRACFTKASLAPGASVTYKLVARVDVGATGTFVNHATTVADNAPSRSATATVRATPATRKPRNGVQGVVG